MVQMGRKKGRYAFKKSIESAFADIDVMESVKGICMSKADEFGLYGYKDVDYDQVWSCVTSSYKRELPAMHRLVNDIMTLDAKSFMNWLMLTVYRSDSYIPVKARLVKKTFIREGHMNE